MQTKDCFNQIIAVTIIPFLHDLAHISHTSRFESIHKGYTYMYIHTHYSNADLSTMVEKQPGHINMAIHGGLHESSMHLISLVLLVSSWRGGVKDMDASHIQL